MNDCANGVEVGGSAPGGAAIRVNGRSTSRPSIARFGLIPVLLCGVIPYAARIAGKRFGQSAGLSSAVVRNIWRIVRLARSV